MIESAMPLIRTSRGLQKGIPRFDITLKIADLLDWYQDEVSRNTKLAQIVQQELRLMVDGDRTDDLGLYTNDGELQEAYRLSANIFKHRITTRNAPLIRPDANKCIESLWFLPPFEGQEGVSYRLTHRSFDIKAAGYSDLLIAVALIYEDATLNNYLARARKGFLYWTAYNTTVYVESDGITPIKGVARRWQ